MIRCVGLVRCILLTKEIWKICDKDTSTQVEVLRCQTTSLTYRLTARPILNSFMNSFGKLYAKPVDVSFNTPPSSFHTDGLFDAPKVMEEILPLDERNIITATKGREEWK